MSDEIPEARSARDEVRKNFQKPFYLSEPEFSDPVLITIQSACLAYAERVAADLRAKLAEAENSSKRALDGMLDAIKRQGEISQLLCAAIARAEAAEKALYYETGKLESMKEQRDSAEKALRALGYEKHGIGWAITVAESP